MLGNVAEWCHDRYAKYLSGRQIDPSGPIGSHRVVEVAHGSNSRGTFVRRNTFKDAAGKRYTNYGFRPARSNP